MTITANLVFYELQYQFVLVPGVESKFNGGHRRARVAVPDLFKGILRDNQLQRRTSSDEVHIQQLQEYLSTLGGI